MTVAGVVVAALAVLVAVVVAARQAGFSRATHQRLERDVERAWADRDAAALATTRLVRGLDAVTHGIVVWDEAGREVVRNAAAAAFVGARHGDALVESAVRDGLRAALDGEPDSRELDLFGPPRRALLLSAVPVSDGDRLLGAVAVIEDVSERRRLEAVRRDFVANISHELKTPVGALGLLAETLGAEDDPVVSRRLAERMTNEAFRVARTIDDLLDLSRIEAEPSVEEEVTAVHAVVAEAVERIAPVGRSRHIRLDVEVPRRHAVRGDRRQLVSAVANLLENACKYSDAGSTVTVRSRADGSWVEIDVADSGVGIPEQDLERVFERFYRVDRARSRETGGTGLGLAIVRHVAGNHGGEVRVRSHEGEGSVFTLRLPAGPGPVALPAEAG
ncbi:MAG TPA: ATP-binding protein [Acidimicrobiales bacterium]|jgi:two-component system sensor histidine kinase SenX3|nr:ATP-binding protein [Acidimicrobiales bacterium]